MTVELDIFVVMVHVDGL